MMKKNKIALAMILSTFAAPTFAAEDRGMYLVGVAGETSGITNVERVISASGLLGYKFNRFISVEGGMMLFAEQAKYIVPPVGYTVGSTYSSTSIAGTEFAAKFSLPLGDWFSLYGRFGTVSFERTNSPSPAEVEVAWKGTTYGVGMQVILPDDYSLGEYQMNIGFRLGINKYNIKDSTGLLSETPSISYAAGVIQF